MEKVEPGKYVEIVYDVYEVTDNGEEILVYQVDENEPEKIISGVTHGVIAPLEKALQGLKAGDSFSAFVNAGEGYGDYEADKVIELEKSMFEVDGKFDEEMVSEGNTLPMMTADGFQILGKVVKVGDNTVTMDFNHPVAGKNIRFKGKVVTVRDATPEEINAQHGCGCGCHGHNHDGCGCNEDCHCEG